MQAEKRRQQDRPLVTPQSMIRPRRIGWALGVLCAGVLLPMAPDLASAQGRLEAHYEATLAGIPVGRGTWTIDIGDDQFSAAASGGTSGLFNTLAGGAPPRAAPAREVRVGRRSSACSS